MQQETNIITILHDELGLSDNDIAYVGRYTRTYITLVRNGKRNLSTEAHNKYVEIYHQLKEVDYTPKRAKYGSKKKEKKPPIPRLPLPHHTHTPTVPTSSHTRSIPVYEQVPSNQHHTSPSAPALKYQQTPQVPTQHMCNYCHNPNNLHSYVINNITMILCTNCIKKYENSICALCGFSQESTSTQRIQRQDIRLCSTCLYKVKHNLVRLHP